MTPDNDIATNVLRQLGTLIQAIKAVFPQVQGTATSATSGAASALPATPAGYVIVTLSSGATVKVPYYGS